MSNNNSEMMNLDELRNIILHSQELEKKRKGQTRLVIEDNPNREKVKKMNPKFCHEWNNLDLDSQINRLIEFVSRFSSENDLTAPTSKKVRKLLVKSLIHENLDVDYDSEVGIITKIPKLYYSNENGYYLGTYLNEKGEFIFRVSKISKCHNGSQNMSIVTEDFQTDPKKSLILTKK